jgi:hemerythrin-like domain-containing protein
VQRFFCKDLISHFRAEEEVLFPALTESSEWTVLVGELRADHRFLRQLVERMERASEGERRELLREFANRLEKHIRWEENELFPLYERLADEVLKQAVGEKLRGLDPRQSNLDPALFFSIPGTSRRRMRESQISRTLTEAEESV